MVLDESYRWSDYFMVHGPDFSSFWKMYLNRADRNLMFVVGRGFDPRMCHIINLILNMGGKGSRDCVALDYNDNIKSGAPNHVDISEENWESLNRLIKENKGSVYTQSIKMRSEGGRRYASFSAANAFDSLEQFNNYTDIIVDVSAMPCNIYFPLLHKLLVLIDIQTRKDGRSPNLHLVVSEDPKLDINILEEGLEENASYLRSFGAIDLEANKEMAKVWIPILGERQQTKLDKLRSFLNPDEVCPLFPFPSRDPRRADNLIAEYRRFLFDDLSIEPHNIIYADERNPFQVYREIIRTVDHYNAVLDVIGGCKVIISPISSKLLSIGALLAAFELKLHNQLVGVTNVECESYRIDGNIEVAKSAERRVPYEIWLTGECYGA